MITLSPAWNGFLKGLLLVIVAAVVSYASDATHLAPILGDTAALVLAALASSFESHIKDQTGNGLFGMTRVR